MIGPTAPKPGQRLKPGLPAAGWGLAAELQMAPALKLEVAYGKRRKSGR